MDTEEALDLGQHSIEKVSRIATFVGQKKQRIVCGRLGAELFILADYLQGLSDQVDQLLKVPKLLRDIERICCVSARGYSFCHWNRSLYLTVARKTEG